MDLNSIPLFKMISRRMTWLNQRQKVLAQNIANADTPGYRPQDLVPVDFSKLAAQAERTVSLAATNPRHIRPRDTARRLQRARAEEDV